MTTKTTNTEYVLCVRNEKCEDLEIKKIYQVLPDKRAFRDGYIRVVDETGEDYLYPEAYFVSVRIPQQAQRALVATA